MSVRYRPAPPWRHRATRRLMLRYLAAVALLVFFLFPVYWLFMISFKTPEEIFASPPLWYPESLQFANYAVLFRDGDAITVWNSLVVAGVSTLLAMLLGTIAAYSIAHLFEGFIVANLKTNLGQGFFEQVGEVWAPTFEGAVVLLAHQDGPPLWVRIKSTSDSLATIVELAGAVRRPNATKPAS